MTLEETQALVRELAAEMATLAAFVLLTATDTTLRPGITQLYDRAKQIQWQIDRDRETAA